MNQIEWTLKARKGLAKVNQQPLRAKIYQAVSELTQWPQCNLDIKKLQGRQDYRLRVGNYRVIFNIDSKGNPIIIAIQQVEKRDERTY